MTNNTKTIIHFKSHAQLYLLYFIIFIFHWSLFRCLWMNSTILPFQKKLHKCNQFTYFTLLFLKLDHIILIELITELFLLMIFNVLAIPLLIFFSDFVQQPKPIFYMKFIYIIKFSSRFILEELINFLMSTNLKYFYHFWSPILINYCLFF